MATIKALIPLSGGRNKLTDPRLTATTMSLQGATVVDTRPATGGPDGGSFFRRTMTTANTSSPMIMSLAGAGLAGIPVTAGQSYAGSWYAAKSAGGPQDRASVNWYDAAGVIISTTTGTNMSSGTSWARHTEIFVAPALAAFARLNLAWSGTALVGQTLDFAMAQFEAGSTASTWTDNQTVNPLLILDYGFSRESRNIVLDLLGSKYPAVFLREAQSRSGTLTMLFSSAAASNDADAIFQSVNRFHFQESAAAQDFHFIRSGPVAVVKLEAANIWTVAVGFREVAPL